MSVSRTNTTKPLISRRTVLRGVGVTIALPLLDAMLPRTLVHAAEVANPAQATTPVRLACLYMPNGVNPHAWTPEGAGREFKLSPILEPLEAVKDQLLVFTQLEHKATNTGDGHYVKTAGWLTGSRAMIRSKG